MDHAELERDFAALSLTEDQIEILQQLRILSQKTGYEYGVVESRLGFSAPFHSSAHDRVAIDPALYANGPVDLFHSHTNDTTLSRDDFALLLNQNVKSISVITRSGKVYSARIGDGETPDFDEFSQAVAGLYSEALFELMARSDVDSIPYEERFNEVILIQAYRIKQHFKWTLEGGKP